MSNLLVFKNNIIKLQKEHFVILRMDGSAAPGALLQMITAGYNVVNMASLTVKFMAEQNVLDFVRNLQLPVYLENAHYVPEVLPALVQCGLDSNKVLLSCTQSFFLQKLIGADDLTNVRFVELPAFVKATEKSSYAVCAGSSAGVSCADVLTNGDNHNIAMSAEPFVPTDALMQSMLQRQPQGSVFARMLASEKDADAYVRLVLQRDVFSITGISDISKFYRFMGAVAAMAGNIISYATLGSAVEVSAPTAKQWLQLLLGTGMVYELPAVQSLKGKRMIKVSKLYFKDTAVAAFLLQLNSLQSLQQSIYMKKLYENYMLNVLRESFLRQGIAPQMEFYRDSNNHEISVLLTHDGVVYPINISMGEATIKRSQKDAAIVAQYAAEQGLRAGTMCVLSANGQSKLIADGIYQLNAGVL